MRFVDVLVAFQEQSEVNVPVRAEDGMHQRTMRVGTSMLYLSAGSHAGNLLEEANVDPWRVWLLGELFSYGDQAGSSSELFSVVCADLRDGRLHPSLLNGHFALLAHNGERRQWHVWTNRLGTIHLYHAASEGRAALGSFFPSVTHVASRRQLDWAAIAGFFSYSFFPGNRTFFEDTRILRPASHYVFDSDGECIKQVRYWDWWYAPEAAPAYSDALYQFRDRLHVVMAGQTRKGRVALSISGGLDSRTAVAALGDVGQLGSLWSYSYGYSDASAETRIAERVARARRLSFDAFTIRPYLFENLPDILRATEGFQDVTQCRQVSVTDDLASRAEYVIGAHMGDLWLDSIGIAEADQVGTRTDELLPLALRKITRRGQSWLLSHICPPTEPWQDELTEIMSEELRAVSHIKDIRHRLKAFKVDQWVFRLTNVGLRAYQLGAFPRLPFYDNRLVDFFCTLPQEYLTGRRLQIDYLKEFAPDLARITWQQYDANLYRYPYHRSLLLPKRILKRVGRGLRRQTVWQRNWEVQFLNEEGRRSLEDSLLRSSTIIHHIVSPIAIRSLLEAFYSNPNATNGYTVSMLLSFASWLNTYCGTPAQPMYGSHRPEKSWNSPP